MPAFPLPPPAHDLPVPHARPGIGGTRLLLGAPYAALPAIRPLELDLYLPPETGEPVPVVVFLHGGCWKIGSRHIAGPMYANAKPTAFERLAQTGIAVASIDYRLSGEATFPAQLHDAKAAVRWVRARSAELGTDPDRIAAWGESAGGHLAELVGLTGDDPAMEGDVGIVGTSSDVSAVVAWYAPSDITAVATDGGADPADPTTREAELLGAAVASVPELAAQASPMTHVTAQAPSFLILHGTADRLIPCIQSQRLYDALVEAGVEAELELNDGADHGWMGSPETAQRAVDRTIDFLRHRLGVTEPRTEKDED